MNRAGLIVETESGYLVPSEDLFSNPVSVERINGNGDLSCKCLEAITNLHVPCQHIRAVEEFQKSASGMLDQARVDKLLFIIRNMESQMAENEQSAQSQLDEVAMWLETANGKLDKQRRYLLYKCRQWLEHTGKRSASLVNGVIKLRSRQDKLEIQDEEAVLAEPRFQREIPARFEVDKKAIRDHYKSTGEIPTGVEFIPQDDQFSCTCYNLERRK